MSEQRDVGEDLGGENQSRKYASHQTWRRKFKEAGLFAPRQRQGEFLAR